MRELENVIAQAVLRARGPVIQAEDLALRESRLYPASATQEAAPASPSGADLEPLFDRHAGNVFAVAEQLLGSKALERAGRNQVQAARLPGISRNVLRDRMKRYSLS